MDVNVFCRNLHFSEQTVVYLASNWAILDKPEDSGMPTFLSMEFFRRYAPYCRLADYARTEAWFERMVAVVSRSPELQKLAWIVHRGNFLAVPQCTTGFLPQEIPALKELSGVFYFGCGLSAASLVEKSYAELNLPDFYAHDVWKWLGGAERIYAAAHNGEPGFTLSQLYWIRHYIDKQLFRIGRLEFLLETLPSWLPPIYRNAEGKIAVLAGDNWRFDKQGLRAANDTPDDEVQTSHLEQGENTITGIPVNEAGLADFSHKLTLDLNRWHPAYAPWDMIPTIHIPGGEKLPFEAVKEAMQLAFDFFKKFFRRSVPLFCCESWILNPVWRELMPDSNVTRFQLETRAIPGVPPTPRCGMFFLFGRDDCDPVDLPGVNHAQQAMQQAFRMNRLGVGSMFVLTEDIDKLGNQFYRKKGDK